MKQIVGAAALVLVLGSAEAGAQTKKLECMLDAGASMGWIGKEMYFTYDAKAGTATAIDGLIQHFYKKPIDVKLTYKEGVKAVFGWRIQTTDSHGSQANMIYRAAYFFDGNKLTVSATPPGYSNSFEARGTCK